MSVKNATPESRPNDWSKASSLNDVQISGSNINSAWLTQNTSHGSETIGTTLSHSSSHSSPVDLGFESSVPSTPRLSSPSESHSSDGYRVVEDAPGDVPVIRSDTFQDLLLGSLEDHPHGLQPTRFFPKTTFDNLITEQIVNRELRHCLDYLEPAAREDLKYKICGIRSFKKIFALLTLVDRQSDIKVFVEQDVADNDLPLVKMRLKDSNLFGFGRLQDPCEGLEPLKCFDGWSPASMRIFDDWQWTTLAPTFQCGERKNIKHLELTENTPLPFTYGTHYGTDSGTSIEGGQSTVFRVNIHPAHHSFGELNRGGSFAVKRLSSKSRAQFRREVEMLETFSGDASPHLISLLATYEQHKTFYLVFFWAEADLQSFWRDINPFPNLDSPTILWMAQQCLGIAKGLSALHNYTTFSHTRLKSVFGESPSIQGRPSDIIKCQLYGVHGDIKPQNVLWFRSSSENPDHGNLKISDFGLAEFKTDPGEIYKPSQKVAYSASYRPPERDSKDGFVGRSHDIWALGCLYLEMIAWVLGGWQLVQEFQAQRAIKGKFSYYEGAADAAFFHIESLSESGIATVAVKPAVIQFIDFLHGLPNCTRYLHSFLDLIQTGMLVIKSTTQTDNRRIEILELIQQLNTMKQNCEDADFATRPVLHHKS